jgi:hypothetical protein
MSWASLLPDLLELVLIELRLNGISVISIASVNRHWRRAAIRICHTGKPAKKRKKEFFTYGQASMTQFLAHRQMSPTPEQLHERYIADLRFARHCVDDMLRQLRNAQKSIHDKNCERLTFGSYDDGGSSCWCYIGIGSEERGMKLVRSEIIKKLDESFVVSLERYRGLQEKLWNGRQRSLIK